jgi:RimJ/RimL family protein N-acetyltransferase
MAEARIVDFRPEHAQAFKALNLAWIQQHWTPDEVDLRVLERPQENILDRGGYIAMAELNGKLVGTCALLRIDDYRYELAKMTVAESARGEGLGRRLGEAVIARARALGAHSVFLESNSAFTAAIQLYENLGFRYLAGARCSRDQCNVQMELLLDAWESSDAS